MSAPTDRRTFLRTGARLGMTGAAAGVLGWAGHAQQPATSPASSAATRSRSGAEFINQDTQAAIDRGLDFLARSQFSDGSFTERERSSGATVGVTALAGLAFMAGGH